MWGLKTYWIGKASHLRLFFFENATRKGIIKNKEKRIWAGILQQKVQSIVTYNSVFWSDLRVLKAIPEGVMHWKMKLRKANWTRWREVWRVCFKKSLDKKLIFSAQKKFYVIGQMRLSENKSYNLGQKEDTQYRGAKIFRDCWRIGVFRMAEKFYDVFFWMEEGKILEGKCYSITATL